MDRDHGHPSLERGHGNPGRLERLARDLMIQEAAIADLQKRGFTLISVTGPDLMANDPTRVLMRRLMGAVAQ